MGTTSGRAATAGMSTSALRQAADAILTHDTFLLTTHREPDGDGLGAESGFYAALVQMGKNVRIVNNDPLPDRFGFLPYHEAFETYDATVHDEFINGVDAVVVLDAAHPNRTGRMEPALISYGGLTLTIDHHQFSGWAAIDLVDSNASAAAQVAQALIEVLPVALTPDIANALYVGLASDTQNFTTANTTASSHESAARLVQAGADPAEANRLLSATWEIQRARLLGSFLANLELSADEQMVWGLITGEDLSKYGVDRSELEGFVNRMLMIASAKTAMMLVEEPDGSYRISMRARPGLRVDDLAEALGGGGHRLAAGARVSQARGKAMIEVLRRYGGMTLSSNRTGTRPAG